MSWIAVGVSAVSVISSVSGDIANNKAQKRNNEAIRNQANTQAKIKRAYLKQATDIQMSELYSMADEFDKEVGIDLTNLLYESEKMKGQIVNTTASRNIGGNIATRLNTTAEIQKELSNDMLQSEVENKYKALGKEIASTKLNYERESLDIELGLASSLSQQNFNFKSGLNIGLSAVTSGAQGYMAGSGLSKAFSSTPNTVTGNITGASRTARVR